MFHRLCKNQTYTLFTFVIIKGLITIRKKKFSLILLLVITTIVIIMSFYDIIKLQKRFLMVSYNVTKKIDNQDFAQL